MNNFSTALKAPAAYAQAFLASVGDLHLAIRRFKAGIDADGRWQGYPGTRQWALDVLAELEGPKVTDADLEGLRVLRTIKGTFFDGRTNEQDLTRISIAIIAVANGITHRQALDLVLTGAEVEGKGQTYRLVEAPVTPKAPDALTVDELASELTQELPGDLIDAQGGRWHVQVTAISHIRPDRALWVYRALANTSDVKPGVLGFYAASLRRAKVELGIEPEGPKGLNVDELQALADLKAAKPALPAITPDRAYVIVSRYSSPVIRSAGRRLGDWLSEDERVALVAYIGSDDVALVNAWIEALADLCPPEERKDPAADFRKLQEGHEAFVRAERQAKARADAIAQRSRSLQAFQDSRNALQVAA